jgi:hypothetical protein
MLLLALNQVDDLGLGFFRGTEVDDALRCNSNFSIQEKSGSSKPLISRRQKP